MYIRAWMAAAKLEDLATAEGTDDYDKLEVTLSQYIPCDGAGSDGGGCHQSHVGT